MNKTQLLKKCMEALQGTDSQELIEEIQGFLEGKVKDRVVIKMDGGVVQEIISDRPMDVLKIEEAGDLEEEDLLEMYPDGSELHGGDTHVYAVIRHADCDPDAMEDEFEKYEKASFRRSQEASPRSFGM